ncbi:MAG TPA: O-antigen polymerase [Actinomycetales bacterium]
MTPATRSQGVWWLSPPGAVLLVVPVTLWLAVSADDAQYRASWRTAKALTDSTAGLFALGAACFVAGGLWPLLLRSRGEPNGRWPSWDAVAIQRLRSASSVVFWMTMVGYLALGAAGVARGARPAQLVAALTGQNAFSSVLREQFAPVTGITTFTQLGIAYVVIAVLLLTLGWDRRLVRRLALVMVLALMRTFFLTERLAILELAIPAVAVVSLAITRAPSPRLDRLRRLVQVAPLVFVPTVIGLFSLFEYSRSWVFYSQRGGSFASFAIDRLAGYYSTAYNNGQLALTYGDQGVPVPYGSIEALWTAPGAGQLDLYSRLTGIDEPNAFATILVQHGNPEFNSPGGLSIPFLDFGTVGGLVFFFALGSVLSLMYRRCCEGSDWTVLIYPVLVTGLFEMPRYLYFGQGRVAPSLVALLVVHWYVSRGARAARPLRSPILEPTT